MDRSLPDSTSVFYRDPGHDYPVAVRGEGVYVYDANGKQYLDGSGGAAITCLGYCHPEVSDAIREQVGKLAFAHTAAFTNEPQEKLAARLAARFADSDISEPGARVYFVSGGSEANETALKLVRQYWVARGRDDKHLMISRQQSYHGNTLGALSLAGNPERSKVYAPLLQQWPKIEPCYAYRHQRQDESDEAYGRRSAAALEDAILEHGAENIAAFFAEPVVGATMGAVPATGLTSGKSAKSVIATTSCWCSMKSCQAAGAPVPGLLLSRKAFFRTSSPWPRAWVVVTSRSVR